MHGHYHPSTMHRPTIMLPRMGMAAIKLIIVIIMIMTP